MSNGINMKSPKITILMSVYNGEKYLREAIDSILNQTFKDFEFLIINDGSTDRTVEILRSYHDSRIKIITNEKNMGLTKSLNKGLKIARSEYVARMDADDISYSRRLEVQYEYMKKNPDVGIVGSWNDVIDDKGNTIDYRKHSLSSEDIYYILNFRNCLTHSSILFRRDLIINNGGYNENISVASDYELWNRISKIAKIYQIPKSLVKWRRTKKSITSKKRSSQIETVNSVVRNNLERLTHEKIDKKVICFIHGNLHYLSILTEDELLHSIKLINKINESIINDAPSSLNKDNIRKVVGNKLIDYICISSFKVSMLNSARCVYRYIKGNIRLKIKIIILIIFKKLEYFVSSQARMRHVAHKYSYRFIRKIQVMLKNLLR
ncbi:MAG: glycosyltransferase [Candidatus Methylarchaceae archaeon HK01M]|nr:glycosyltransferase [Candidatus Methylarchaceae archaeon HK01M]